MSVKFKYLIGLDLVFSGLSGLSIFKNGKLVHAGFLTNQTQSTSDSQKKVTHGTYLAGRVDGMFSKAENAICVIEKPEWHQKGGVTQKVYNPKLGKMVEKQDNSSAGRERRALQSLALSRGIVTTLALVSEKRITPYYMPISQERAMTLGSGRGSKENLFSFINSKYQLQLKSEKENMNITDAVALGDAFLKIVSLPDGLDQKFLTFQQVSKAIKVRKVLDGAFESMGIMDFKTAVKTKPADVCERLIEFNKTGIVGKKKTPSSGGIISVDISARNPGIIVGIPEKGETKIVFHKTFGLKNKMPDNLDISYEMLVAGNILLSMLSTYLMFEPTAIVFEYSDWHRGGSGLDYQIEIKAINSLFFTYGSMMAIAYLLNLPLYTVGATEAKKAVLGKKNATKEEVKNYIHAKYPFLKNEHTRDAALLLDYYLRKKA